MKIIDEIRHEINLIVTQNLAMGKFDADKIRLIEINRVLDKVEENNDL